MDLRARGKPFQGLAKGPWALFIAIAVHWQGNAEAWPSQEALARFSGWSSRAVRDQADTLERGGFIRLRRERRGDGSERIFYAPGLVTLAELAGFVDRFPRERIKAPQGASDQAPSLPLLIDPPEVPSGAPPERSSMELSDLNFIKPSSCEMAPTTSAAPPSAPMLTEAPSPTEQEKSILVTDDDRAVARAALAERMKRKHPSRPVPHWFDACELAMVAACSSAIEGDRETKLQTHRDAIAGAYLASKDGPPTARFVWGKLEHFLDHVERARTKARAEERAAGVQTARPRPRPERIDDPRITPAQMKADIDRLFSAIGGTNVPR